MPEGEHPAVAARPYTGLAGPGESEVIIRKSRFLGFAWPVDDVKAAEDRVAALRDEHREARHVCYAYRVGIDAEDVRSSDDGEPSGTAGRPILEVLVQRDIRYAAVAVVRYFGGVLLGAPGLVRAYSQAASQALDDAQVATMIPCLRASFTLPYPLLGKFRYMLAEAGGQEEDARYGEDITLSALLPGEAWPAFSKQLESFGPQLVIERSPGIHYRAR